MPIEIYKKQKTLQENIFGAVFENYMLHSFYLTISDTLISLTATYLPFLFSKRHI